MSKRLRLPAFLIAIVLLLVFLGLEIGSAFITVPVPGAVTGILSPQDAALAGKVKTPASPPPGIGISYLALVDVILTFTIILMALGLVVPRDKEAKVQGCATCLFSGFLFLTCIGLIFVAIALVLVMVALLLAFPFGTIIYLIVYGFFDRDKSSFILSAVMSIKLMFGVALLLAHQRMLQNKGFVLLIMTSLVATLIVSTLQGIVPSVFTSITDGISAIVVGIIAAIWCVILMIGSLFSIPKALKG